MINKIIICLLILWLASMQLKVLQLDHNQYQLKSSVEKLAGGLIELKLDINQCQKKEN